MNAQDKDRLVLECGGAGDPGLERQFRGPRALVSAVSFHPKGHQLASSSHDNCLTEGPSADVEKMEDADESVVEMLIDSEDGSWTTSSYDTIETVVSSTNKRKRKSDEGHLDVHSACRKCTAALENQQNKECSIFGEYVANELRVLASAAPELKLKLKILIRKAITKASMQYLDRELKIPTKSL